MRNRLELVIVQVAFHDMDFLSERMDGLQFVMLEVQQAELYHLVQFLISRCLDKIVVTHIKQLDLRSGNAVDNRFPILLELFSGNTRIVGNVHGHDFRKRREHFHRQ